MAPVENVISIKPGPKCLKCEHSPSSYWKCKSPMGCIYRDTEAYLNWTKHLQDELKITLILISTVTFQVGPFYEG